MRILITGGAGFIGSHLADRFLREGFSVRILDNLHPRVHPKGPPTYLSSQVEFMRGDVTSYSDWESALDGVDVVSHQAAYQDYAPDYSQFTRVNVAGTALLFEVIAAKKFPVRKVVVASSQAVYGEGQYYCEVHGLVLPSSRDVGNLDQGLWEICCPTCGGFVKPTLLDEAHSNPLSPYGISKYAQEITALKLAAFVGIPATALRYSITQGPRQSLFNQYSGIARIFTLRLSNDRSPIAFEDGLMQRDYVHVADVVEANWIVTNDERAVGRAFNVGSGISTTIVEYAERLAERMGKRIRPSVPGIYRRGDARHSVSSIEKLKSLGWRPQRTLSDILDDFLAWADGLSGLDSGLSDTHEKLLEMRVLRLSSGCK
jgi:dTDP-L-rhamnose 4-epimerase